MTKKRLFLLITVIAICVILLLFVQALAIRIIRDKEDAKEQQRYYQNRISSYEVENVITDDYQIDVAFIGDRVIAEYEVVDEYTQYKVLNRAIDGESTEQLQERLKVSLYDLKPKVIVLLVSDEDYDTMIENYDSILDGIHKNLPDSKVVLLSLPPVGGKYASDNDDICFTNAKIKLLAKKYDYEYLDIYVPLFDLYEDEIFGAFAYDGKLLTPSGYHIITRELSPLLESILSDWTMP